MSNTSDLREQIAAWLAGDLDAPAVEALEARMASEPWVADEADRMADMLTALGGVDEVRPPDGFSSRLHAALDEAVGTEVMQRSTAAPDLAAAGAAAADGWAPSKHSATSGNGEVVSLSTRRRLSIGLGVAASVAVLAIASLTVLSGSEDDSASETVAMERAAEVGAQDGSAREDASAPAGEVAVDDEMADEDMADDEMADDSAAGGSTDESLADTAAAEMAEDGGGQEMAEESGVAALPADDAAEAGDAEAADAGAAEPEQDDADDPAASSSAGDDADAPLPEATATSAPDPGAGPQVGDLGAVTQDEAVARATELPAVQRAIDTPEDRAAEVARANRDEILRSPAFTDGTEPGACLREILGGNPEDVIPAVAVRHVSDGALRLSYVLVDTGSDQVRTWTVEADTCALVAVTS